MPLPRNRRVDFDGNLRHETWFGGDLQTKNHSMRIWGWAWLGTTITGSNPIFTHTLRGKKGWEEKGLRKNVGLGILPLVIHCNCYSGRRTPLYRQELIPGSEMATEEELFPSASNPQGRGQIQGKRILWWFSPKLFLPRFEEVDSSWISIFDFCCIGTEEEILLHRQKRYKCWLYNWLVTYSDDWLLRFMANLFLILLWRIIFAFANQFVQIRIPI